MQGLNWHVPTGECPTVLNDAAGPSVQRIPGHDPSKTHDLSLDLNVGTKAKHPGLKTLFGFC